MPTKIAAQKETLRKYFKQKRLALSPQEIQKESIKINQNFIENLLPQLLEQKPDAKFSLYFSTTNEVNTDKIAQHFIKNNIIFSYPKIIAKNQPLDFIKFTSQKTMPSAFYKTIQEIDGEKITPDFIILPLLAFDKNKNRLGMGGGFFDRTLEHLFQKKQKVATIGLAFQCQLYKDNLPCEKTDQRLDFIALSDQVFF